MSKNTDGRFSIVDRFRSFKFAFKGIVVFIRDTHNAWIHLLAAVLVVSMGFYFSISSNEWLALVIVIGFVLVTEAINSAIELLVDLVSPDFNEKAGRIKDIAAGAVLLAAITAMVVGLIIFVPYFL